MKQAIPGMSSSAASEVTAMIVWPSNAAHGIGRTLGQLYAIEAGVSFLTVGNLIALLTSPIGILIYISHVLPGVGTRYRLTNRRVIVERGLTGTPERSIELDRFDRIEVVVRPGQEWYAAGDLVFYLGDRESFRLKGVSRPEAFNAACIKAMMTYTGIKKVQERQAIPVPA